MQVSGRRTHCGCNDPHYDYKASEDIGRCPERCERRRSNVCDLSPIEGHWEKSQTRANAELNHSERLRSPHRMIYQVRNENTFGSKPSDDATLAQCRHQKAGQGIPSKRSRPNQQKKLPSRNQPPIGRLGFGAMHSSKHGCRH